MGDSLRDQLIKSGLAKAAPEPVRVRRRNQPARKPPPDTADKTRECDVDLARAYAMRARTEARERKQARVQAEAEARARKERKQRLERLVGGKSLNKKDADLVRHFEYGGKIRRIHVDRPQLDALNAGHLGVVQLAGRYLLVASDVVREVMVFAPDHVALLVDPDARGEDDGVPDDLVW